MNKKISVIVAVYNTEKYVEKCLNALLNQTYQNLEIIVVEDGSTVNSRNGYKQVGFGSDAISDDLVVPYQIYGVK